MNVDKLIKKAATLRFDKNDSWVMERRPFNIPVEEIPDSHMPDALVCISLKTGVVIGIDLISPDAAESDVIAWMLQCLTSPMEGKPHRPALVTLTGGKLGSLKEELTSLGIPVNERAEQNPMIDEIVSVLASNMLSGHFQPYLTNESLDPDTIEQFFHAAAKYYKLKPWKLFKYELPIRIDLICKTQKTYWAVVVGVAGKEAGLALYECIDDLQDAFDINDDEAAIRMIQSLKSINCAFCNVDDIGAPSVDEYITQGWEVASKQAYPLAVLNDPNTDETTERPTDQQLQELTASLLALTSFINEHKNDIKAEHIIKDARLVNVSGQETIIIISFPAPELLLDDEDDDEYDDLSPLD